jgi:MoxR-like ATPase
VTETTSRDSLATEAWVGDLRASLAEVVIGQEELVHGLLLGLLTGGHVLLEGVPGLAKSLVVSTLAEAVEADFVRLQFTPDLLPSDLVGTEIYDTKTGSFQPRKGPIFANFVLADEINRAPAKVQSALLEGMQERQVSIGGQTFALPHPFLVLATQNPIEQEGTYPLPEAQLDRFLLEIQVGYPSQKDEEEIVRRTTAGPGPEPQSVLSRETILDLQALIPRVPVAEHVVQHAVALARATRPESGQAPQVVKDYVRYGAGPRASQSLIVAAKARAALDGRFAASIEDVRHLAAPVLRHRLVPSYRAEADGVDQTELIAQLLGAIKP